MRLRIPLSALQSLKLSSEREAKVTNFLGQWIGEDKGTNSGPIMMDVDQVGSKVLARVYKFDLNSELFDVLVEIDLSYAVKGISGEFNVKYFDRNFGRLVFLEELNDASERGFEHPDCANIEVKFVEADKLRLSWSTSIGTYGSGFLVRQNLNETSRVIPSNDLMTWEQFKSRSIQDAEIGEVYRGQRKPWPLSTTFHRQGRADIHRYIYETFPPVSRRLSELHPVYLNEHPTFNAMKNSSLMGFAQHFGFPTPLIDWTRSPYVAMFFAVHEAAKRMEGHLDGGIVRIFSLHLPRLDNANIASPSFSLSRPHFTALDALSLGNDRLRPQQGLLTATNIVDVEKFLLGHSDPENPIIECVDVEIQSFQEVLSELRLMGITNGSLFPGVQGEIDDLYAKEFVEAQ